MAGVSQAAWRVQPLTDLTWLRPHSQRRRSPFTASWSATDALLMREVAYLNSTDVALEMDVELRHIRRSDGWIRADAKPRSPALRLLLETKRGALVYETDAYLDWRDNLRAIALSLENLRAMERYGVLTGQQYVGSLRAIEAGSSVMTEAQARACLCRWAGVGWGEWTPERTLRVARIEAHPDRRGGDHTAAYDVDKAARRLGLA